MSAPIPDEQAALLAAIVAEPDEDTPRLVYADWLQEHGDEEQATFIRDSVRLEWLEDYEDDRRQKIAERLDDAVILNGAKWLGELGVTGSDLTYDRGMVEGLAYDGIHQFMEDAPTLFARVPVRAVTIGDLVLGDRDWLVVLADMPDLLRLRELRLQNRWMPVPADGFERFVTSRHLENLEVLAIQEAALNDEDMLAFTRTTSLTHLTELGLSGNRLTVAGSLTVVRSPCLPNLRRLGLTYNDIVEDRRRGSLWMQLRDALIDRFDSTAALDLVV
jgi:uncharacterized protein (TIGR02996 family)